MSLTSDPKKNTAPGARCPAAQRPAAKILPVLFWQWSISHCSLVCLRSMLFQNKLGCKLDQNESTAGHIPKNRRLDTQQIIKNPHSSEKRPLPNTPGKTNINDQQKQAFEDENLLLLFWLKMACFAKNVYDRGEFVEESCLTCLQIHRNLPLKYDQFL